MSLKKIFLSILLPCVFLNVKAQDSCIKKEIRYLEEIVRKNISFGEEAYSNQSSEYFLIDIKLNEAKNSIANIDFYRKDKSCNYKQIERAVQKIHELWKPQNCDYNRIIIPVFILFSSATELHDYPIEFKLKSTPDGAKNNTCLLNTIIINVFSRVKKKM